MEQNREIIDNIQKLFEKYYYRTILDSTGTWGQEEKTEFISYSKQHTEEFKIAMQELLSNPGEYSSLIPPFCQEILPDDFKKISAKHIDKFDLMQVAKFALNKLTDYFILYKGFYNDCNLWLNYFNNTTDIDYYEDFAKYKQYLHDHYISWKPNEESDPNPTYEYFVEHKDEFLK